MTHAPKPAPAPDPRLASARTTRLIVMLIYFAVVLGGAYWLWHGHVAATRWVDRVAAGVAALCVLLAGRMLFESFNPVLLGERLQVEGESTPQEGAHVRLQALFLFLLGVVLVLPNVAVSLGWPREAAYAAIAVFAVARAIYQWRTMRRADEYMRRRLFEAGWWTTLATTTGLLIYSGAERLGLARAAATWDVLVLMFLVAVFMPTFMAARAKSSGG
jgi:hypothetical protein